MKEELRLVSQIAEGYTLYFGYREDLVRQLVELSKLPEMIASVPKDAQRFASIEAFMARPLDAQQMYWLVHGDELAGIVWIRLTESTVPTKTRANYTIAIRIYPAHQGKGLSEPFLRTTQQDFIATHRDSNIGGFWLETAATNMKAQHLYQKLGYKKIAAFGDKIVMHLSTQHLS
jgi:GNAT superfamily N-acetyltransferase